MATYEVVLETALYYSVFIEADDAEDASNKAAENHLPPPAFSLPNGFEVEDDGWFIEGVVRTAYDV